MCGDRANSIRMLGVAFGFLVGSSVFSNAGAEDEPIPVTVPSRTTAVDFATEIRPLLQKNCVACHKSNDGEGGLALDAFESIKKGSDSGPVIVPGKGDDSLLLKVAAHRIEPTMPPADNKVGAASLTSAQLGLLKLWIDQGARGTASGASSARLVRRPLAASLQPVLALALSPDDELAACSRGSRLFVYDLRGPRLAAELSDPALTANGTIAADSDLVRSLAFDRTGRWLASGGYRTVRLWQRPRGEKIQEIPVGEAARVFAVSSDGKRFASGSENGDIEIRSLGEGAPPQPLTLKGHTAAVTALQFTADGTRLLSTSADKTLRTWDVVAAKSSSTWTLPSEPRSLALANGNESAAVGGADAVIRLWPLSTLISPQQEAAAKDAPPPSADLKGHSRAVTALAAVPGLKDRLLSGSDDGRVKLWSLAEAKPIRDVAQEGPVLSVALRNDGERFVSVGAKGARLWNGADGALILEIKSDDRTRRQLARADGALVYAKACIEYRKQELRESEEALKREMAVVEGAHKAREMTEKSVTEKTEAAKKAGDARATAEAKAAEATAAAKQATEKRSAAQAALVEADAALKKSNAELEAARTAAGKDKDNKDLATAVSKAEEAAATAKTGRQTAEAALTAATEAFRTAERAGQDAVRMANEARDKAKGPERELKDAQNMHVGAVNFIATATEILEKAKAAVPKAKETFTASETLAAEREKQKAALAMDQMAAVKPLRSAAFSVDGSLLTLAGDDLVPFLVDGTTGAPLETLESDSAPRGTVSIAGDGAFVVATGKDRVSLWKAPTQWTLHHTIGNDGDSGQLADRVLSLDFSPDGKLLATAGGVAASEGELKLWNVADGTLVRAIAAPHRDTVQCVRFSPDGQFLATASADKLVKIFRVDDGSLVQTLAGHGQYVLGVAWSHDGKALASCGTDQVVKLWNLDSGAAKRTMRGTAYRIGEYRRAVTSIQFVGETEHILTSSGDGTVRLHRESHDYDVRAFREVGVFFQSAAGTSDGKLAVAGAQDGSLHFWNAENGYNHVWFTAEKPAALMKPN